MTTLAYSVTLMDCRGVDSATRSECEDLFREALESALGGEQQVVSAYSAYNKVFNTYEETPLPSNATAEERAIVERWENAESAAWRAAFANWLSTPNGAHFEISV